MITKADIERVFGTILARVQNKELRDQAVNTWVAACQRGGWQSIDEVQAMPFTLLTNCHGISFIHHTIAVTEGAYGLAKAQEAAYPAMPYPVNYDRLLVGGLLHDVGKLVEIEKDGQGGFRKSYSGKCLRHPVSGTALAHECGVRDEAILNTIACHAKEGEGAPKCLETILIHQADFATFDPLVMKKAGTLIE